MQSRLITIAKLWLCSAGIALCQLVWAAAPMDVQLRVAREDWATAKNLVAIDAGWKAWVKDRKQLLDGWMSASRDNAEWISGWGHELVDSQTQRPLQWTPQMPMPADGAGAQGKLRQAWVSWQRSYNFARVAEAARLYRLTGEQPYAAWAAGQLDFYAANYSQWPLRTWNGNARMMGQSLDEATGVIHLIEAVRLLGTYAGAAQQATWLDKLFLPITDNLRSLNQGVNNIALWHAVAMTSVGLQFDLSALTAEGLQGPKGVRTLLNSGVTADSIWYEGSFSYNAYVLRALAPLFIQADLSGNSEIIKTEKNIAVGLLIAPLQLRFDDGFLPTPSDANGRSRAIDLGLLFEMHRVLVTRIGRVEAQRRKTWETLLDPITSPLPPLESLQPVQSVHLEATRMAMLRTDKWQVFTHYGQVIQHHAQEEALSSEIYFQSTPVATDPGTVSFGSLLHEQYFRRAVAHNVPLVDGGGQQGWSPGVVKNFDAANSTMTFSQPKYRQDANAERKITVAADRLTEITTIKLSPEAKTDRRLGFVFNTDCQIVLPSSMPIVGNAPPPAGSTGFTFWQGISLRTAPAQWQATLACDGQRFHLSVELQAAHKLYSATAPTTPLPKRRNVIYMELMGKVAAMNMTLTPIAN